MRLLTYMQASAARLETDHSLSQSENPPLQWTPFDFRSYLESREGKVWRHHDTLKILERTEQVDALVEQLIRAAGIEVVE